MVCLVCKSRIRLFFESEHAMTYECVKCRARYCFHKGEDKKTVSMLYAPHGAHNWMILDDEQTKIVEEKTISLSFSLNREVIFRGKIW